MIQTIKRLLTPKVFVVAAVFLTVLIAIGSLMQGSSIPSIGISIKHLDKLFHAVAYFLMTAIWWKAIEGSKKPFYAKITTIAIVIFVYGIIIEVLQELLTTNRQADLYDVLANSFGILSAVVLIIRSKKKLKNDKLK